MGIYSDEKIYGIRFILDGNNLFETKEIQKARLFFDSLTAEEKATTTIFVYISSVSTYSINSQPMMHWVPSKIFQ